MIQEIYEWDHYYYDVISIEDITGSHVSQDFFLSNDHAHFLKPYSTVFNYVMSVAFYIGDDG